MSELRNEEELLILKETRRALEGIMYLISSRIEAIELKIEPPELSSLDLDQIRQHKDSVF